MSTKAHRESEALAQAAAIAMREGDRIAAQRLYTQAAEFESKALAAVSREKKPRTYGVLAVSVVSLQYKAQLFDEAEMSACRFIADPIVSPRSRKQLRELLETIWDERALLEATGLVYSWQEIVIAMRGGVVGAGTAPLDLVVRAQKTVCSLIIRLAEFVGNFEFRKGGPVARELMDEMQLRVTPGQIGSYKFTVRIAEPQQIEMFSERRIDARRLGQTVMDFAETAVSGTAEQLEALVPRPDYRQVALQLLRNIAPTGGAIEEVDIAQRGTGVELRVLRLKKESRRRIEKQIRERHEDLSAGVVQGVLRGLQLDKSWLEVVTDEGETIRCATPPEMLDDVVGPWVNQRVRVLGQWTGAGAARRFYADDVEPEEDQRSDQPEFEDEDGGVV